MKRYDWLSMIVLSVGYAATTVAQAPPAAPPAGAPAAKAVRGPSLDVALAMAQAALAACKSRDAAISVSVVDAAGQAKVTLAADGSPGKTSTSVRKAATAVAFKASGSEMEAREKTDKEFAAKIAANPNDYNDHAGSLPLKVGGEVIGGIGISGATTHEIDEACASEAVAKLQSKLK
ncbi:MAG: heme-binding protein [Steroidobacteraceae bacterium]